MISLICCIPYKPKAWVVTFPCLLQSFLYRFVVHFVVVVVAAAAAVWVVGGCLGCWWMFGLSFLCFYYFFFSCCWLLFCCYLLFTLFGVCLWTMSNHLFVVWSWLSSQKDNFCLAFCDDEPNILARAGTGELDIFHLEDMEAISTAFSLWRYIFASVHWASFHHKMKANSKRRWKQHQHP